MAANELLKAVNARLLSRNFGGLDAGASLPEVPAGSASEKDSITWLLINQYLKLDGTRLPRDEVFKSRTTSEAMNNPELLNGLFTGTERPIRREGDIFRRGMGNTIFGWDGVHPNSAGYSVAVNEAISALVAKLKEADYGGLEKGTVINPVPREMITELLKENYLKLKWSRIYDWQSLITTVK